MAAIAYVDGSYNIETKRFSYGVVFFTGATDADGNRQELHERIRQLSMQAGAAVKEQGLDNNLLEAARDLGANSANVFRRVIFPLSIPGVISGITMVFVPAVTTFVISQILGGGKIYLIGNIIEQEFTLNGNRQLGSGLSLVMMVFILISMALLNKFDKNGEGTLV